MGKITAAKEIGNILKGGKAGIAGEGARSKSSQRDGEWATMSSCRVLSCLCILVSHTGMCEMIQQRIPRIALL